MRKRVIIGLVCAAIMVVLYICFLLPKNVEVTCAQRKLPLRIADLKQLFELDGHGESPTCEYYSATVYHDKTYQIFYEYAPENQRNFYLYSQVDVLRSLEAASSVVSYNNSSLSRGLWGIAGSVKAVENKQLYSGGDQRYTAFLCKEDEVIGNKIIVRKGEKVISFILLGLYIEEPEIMEILIDTKLQHLEGVGI